MRGYNISYHVMGAAVGGEAPQPGAGGGGDCRAGIAGVADGASPQSELNDKFIVIDRSACHQQALFFRLQLAKSRRNERLTRQNWLFD